MLNFQILHLIAYFGWKPPTHSALGTLIQGRLGSLRTERLGAPQAPNPNPPSSEPNRLGSELQKNPGGGVVALQKKAGGPRSARAFRPNVDGLLFGTCMFVCRMSSKPSGSS